MPAKRRPITSITGLRQRCTIAEPGNPDSCWIWKLAHRPNGGAAINLYDPDVGHEVVASAPRAVAILRGMPRPKPGKSWTTCGHQDCCQPNHARTGTYAEWGEWLRKSGQLKGSIKRKVATTAHWRSRSAIDMDIARQMRASPLNATEEARVWSEKLGLFVSHDLVTKVRSGHCWNEPTPFAGLGARNA